MKKILVIAGLTMFVAILIGSIVGTASGTIGGAVGMYKDGCKSCHGSGSGVLGQVVINGPTTAKVGVKASYTVVLIGFPVTPFGGMNAAVENYAGAKTGTMAAGVNTQAREGNTEVSHVPGTGGKAINARIWTFDWTPTETGAQTLYVVGLASNGDGGPNGGDGKFPSAGSYGQLSAVPDMWYLGQQKITVSP